MFTEKMMLKVIDDGDDVTSVWYAFKDGAKVRRKYGVRPGAVKSFFSAVHLTCVNQLLAVCLKQEPLFFRFLQKHHAVNLLISANRPPNGAQMFCSFTVSLFLSYLYIICTTNKDF